MKQSFNQCTEVHSKILFHNHLKRLTSALIDACRLRLYLYYHISTVLKFQIHDKQQNEALSILVVPSLFRHFEILYLDSGHSEARCQLGAVKTMVFVN